MYDPERHHRRSIRLRGHDYGGRAIYHVVLGTAYRKHLFGEVTGNTVQLTVEGCIARNELPRLERSFPHVDVDAFVVMPTHVHVILIFRGAAPEPYRAEFGVCSPGSLASVVGTYKANVTRAINRRRNTPGAPVWQRNYWDVIIRSRRHLQNARYYIADNPRRWHLKHGGSPVRPGPTPARAPRVT